MAFRRMLGALCLRLALGTEVRLRPATTAPDAEDRCAPAQAEAEARGDSARPSRARAARRRAAGKHVSQTRRQGVKVRVPSGRLHTGRCLDRGHDRGAQGSWALRADKVVQRAAST
eukprot:1194177-Rhodomonas_salina.2